MRYFDNFYEDIQKELDKISATRLQETKILISEYDEQNFLQIALTDAQLKQLAKYIVKEHKIKE